ncbi:MAG: ASCH domain-containing protein [Planctomycetaceae bacterium]
MLLLSIHPRFAEAIFDGTKKVELRRRAPKLRAGDEVIVYATVPTAAVLGKFTVKSVEFSKLHDLWQGTRKVAAVSNSEFEAYFDGLEKGVGIWIANMQRYSAPVSLTDLRNSIPGFHPPQGFRYLSADEVKSIENLAKGKRKSTRKIVRSFASSATMISR